MPRVARMTDPPLCGPSIPVSARSYHVAARRSGGQFVFAQDARIPWARTHDFVDIALVVDPDHSSRQLTPYDVTSSAQCTNSCLYDTSTTVLSGQHLGNVASGSLVAQNSSDPNNKARIKRVLVPGSSDKYCWLQRIRQSVDPGTGSTWRAEISETNTNFATQTGSDTKAADRMPYEQEVWWACAILLGDSASYPDGEAETWSGFGTSGTGMVMGHQVHADNAGSGLSPNHAMYMIGGGGGEGTNKLRLQTRRPTTNGQLASTHYVYPGTGDNLWELTGPPMREWLAFIHCCRFSADPAKALTMMWYDRMTTGAFDSTADLVVNNSAAGAVDKDGVAIANYRNDYGIGPSAAHKAATFYPGNSGLLNSSSVRIDPETYSGGNYLRPASMYCYSGGLNNFNGTIRTVPVRWHFRPPWRSRKEYAEDLNLLLRRMVDLTP